MLTGTNNIDDLLTSILRGAAKLLGCGSTNLILINERTQEIRIRLGLMAGSYPILNELEGILGGSFMGLTLPLNDARESMIYKSWRDGTILETSSLLELAGDAFPRTMLEEMNGMIGDHRFISVPALSGVGKYGVLLFQKEGREPFSSQQREVLLYYARRIGEILENDVMDQRQMVFLRGADSREEYFIFDTDGNILGRSPSDPRDEISSNKDALDYIACRAGNFLDSSKNEACPVNNELDSRLEIHPLKVGEKDCALCVVRKKNSSGDLIENQLLQLTLGEAAPSLFLDTELKITSCNEAVGQFLGCQTSELLGRSVRKLFINPDDIVSILEEQLLRPRPSGNEESAVVRKKDGSVIHVHVRTLPLANDLEQVVGFLVLIRDDIQIDMEAERMLLQERMATMGEMAAQLAHEIRNPLVAVGATLESLMNEPDLPRDHRDVISSLGKEIVRVDMILKDYLAARREIVIEKVDLSSVFDEACVLLEGAHKISGKSIKSLLKPGLIVYGDRDALKHVFFNLLLNALEASNKDGEVRCTAVASEHAISVFIDDDGPGLSASQDECFKPFFTTKKNGTGLGLAVCRRIVAAHGGLTELKNRENGGCRATVILPAKARQ